jgi:hypothetical protein
MGNLKNIPLKTFRRYLQHCGLKQIRTKGGHEIWSAKNLTRPVDCKLMLILFRSLLLKIIFALWARVKNIY